VAEGPLAFSDYLAQEIKMLNPLSLGIRVLVLALMFVLAARAETPRKSKGSRAEPATKAAFQFKIDTSEKSKASEFFVPAHGMIKAHESRATAKIPKAPTPWSMKAFSDAKGRLIGVEYVKPGHERPAVNEEFSKEAYRMRAEGVLGPAEASMSGQMPSILKETLTYVQPDEVKFLKCASVKLRFSVGDDKTAVEERVVVAVYVTGSVPGMSGSDAARFSFDSKGKLKSIDNILGGE